MKITLAGGLLGSREAIKLTGIVSFAYYPWIEQCCKPLNRGFFDRSAGLSDKNKTFGCLGRLFAKCRLCSPQRFPTPLASGNGKMGKR
jgi:hypothetical protein